MTSSTKNTIWALGIVGILAFLAYKLWPSLQRAINKGATSGSAGAGSAGGASNASPYYPNYENESASQGNLLSQLLNALSGGSSSGSKSGGGMNSSPSSYPGGNLNSSGGMSALGDAINNLFSDAVNAEDPLAEQSQTEIDQAQSLESDLTQLPQEDIQNFDVNQLAEPIDTSEDQGAELGYDSIDGSGNDSSGSGVDENGQVGFGGGGY